jgi:hypothetical protein
MVLPFKNMTCLFDTLCSCCLNRPFLSRLAARFCRTTAPTGFLAGRRLPTIFTVIAGLTPSPMFSRAPCHVQFVTD